MKDTKETAGNRSMFNAFSERPGYAALKDAIDGLPDVLDYLRTLNTSSTSTHFPSSRTKSPCLSSKSTRSIPSKLTIRPNTTLTSVTTPVYHRSSSPAARFQSRREQIIEITPGPQTYHIQEQTKPMLGTISREPRSKGNLDNTSLGPGSYEPKLISSSSKGFRFPKYQPEAISYAETPPGPGHYSNEPLLTGPAFSISTTKAKVVTTEHLGPGCYEVNTSIGKSQVGRFASAPRFQTHGIDFVPRHKPLNEEEKLAQKKRIEANMDLSSSRLEARKDKLARQSLRRSVKTQITRIAHSGLLETTKWRRQQALEEKFRRYEWRVRIEEVREVQKSWVQVMTYGCWLQTMWVQFRERKDLHQRSDRVLKSLALLSKCIGVIMCKLKRLRLQHSYTTIQRYTPFIKRWLRKAESQHRLTITNSIEYCLTQELMTQLMVRWLGKLRVVQRTIRSFLKTRRLFYIQGKMSWALTEVSMLKTSAKSRTFATEYFEGRASIPDKIKEYYIRLCVQKKLIRFFYEMRNYKKLCAEIKTEYAAQHAGEIPDSDAFPPVPSLCLTLSKEEFKELIMEAERNRLNWDKIQRHVEQPFDRRRPSSRVVIPYDSRRKSKQEFRARSPTVN